MAERWGLCAAAMATVTVMTAGMLPAKAGEPMADFMGHWRVARVAVSDDGVQALSDNDPSLMGKRLTFTAAQLAWDRTQSTGDVCIEPSFAPLERLPPDLQPELHKLGMRQPVAYRVRCRSGSWGPGHDTIMYRGVAGALALPWYDGGVLLLVRDPVSRQGGPRDRSCGDRRSVIVRSTSSSAPCGEYGDLRYPTP